MSLSDAEVALLAAEVGAAVVRRQFRGPVEKHLKDGAGGAGGEASGVNHMDHRLGPTERTDAMDDVFVSSIHPEHWEPDPEVPGSEMHELVDADGTWAGLTRFMSVDGPQQWTPPRRETIHVLEGEVVIEVSDGPTLHLRPGDLASLPAGRETTWHITTPFKELWMFG